MKKTTTIGTALVLVLTVFAISAPQVVAATINVPGDYTTIQEAIDSAASGDTIYVASGTYNEDLTIPIGLTLTGETGAEIIGGIWIKNMHTYTSPITVENFIIKDGTKIDATHDYCIKISGDIGTSDKNVVDMHIIDNTMINCGKTNNVLTEMWFNAAVFYDVNHFGSLGNRYDTVFTGTGEISHNTIVNNLGDTSKRTQLGIGVRSGRNMEINDNHISGNVAEGIHHWGPVNTVSIGNYEMNNNYIDLTGWIGGPVDNNPRGIWSYAPQSSVSYNTIISKWFGIVLTYWDDTYWGGGSAGPNYNLDVSYNLIHPPTGESMFRGLRISGSNSEITYNEIYGATSAGLMFEGWDHPEWGERTECSNNVFEHNYIHDNYDGIYTWDSPYDNTFDNVFHYNKITDNSNYGFYNGHSGEIVDAEKNWWSHSSGPGGIGAGAGDDISDDVDYSPWCTKPNCKRMSDIQVDCEGEYVFTTIQDAVDAANDGDRIVVAGCEYYGAIVTKALDIHGTKGATIVDGPVYKPTASGWLIHLRAGFRLGYEDGGSGSTISGFTFDCQEPSFDEDRLVFPIWGNHANDVNVHHNTLNDPLQGITNWNGNGWNIHHNKIDGLMAFHGGGLGIIIGLSDDTTASDNLIHHNEITAEVSAEDYSVAGITVLADNRWGILEGEVTGNKVSFNVLSVTGENSYGIELSAIGLEDVEGGDDIAKSQVHDNAITRNDMRECDNGVNIVPIALDEVNTIKGNKLPH